MTRTYLSVLVAVVLGAGVATTQAQESVEWAVTPYLFLSGIDMDSTVAGQTVPLDVSFTDVFDTFDDVMTLSLRGEAWKGAWGGIGDIYWVDLGVDGGPNDSFHVKVEEWYVDALAGYRWIMPTKFSRSASAAVTFGLRYHSLEQKIGAAALPRDLGASENWIDIMVGGIYSRPFTESWILRLRGDVGGFDLTDGTKLNYSLNAGAAWEFSRDWLLDLGYRVYGIDYESGSGADNIGMDGITHGLLIGVSYAPRVS